MGAATATVAAGGWLDEVRFDDRGLVTVVAQDAASGRLLMVAWADRAAIAETVATRRAVYWSRSRKRIWRKGEESGHVQQVREIFIDCDADTILLKVKQLGGAACHEGFVSCFFRKLEGDELTKVGERLFDPQEVYKKKK